MKSDEIRLNQNKINKEKLENLYIANPNQVIVLNLEKRGILRELKQRVENKINYAQKLSSYI